MEKVRYVGLNLFLPTWTPLLDYKAFNYSAIVKSWDVQSKANVDIDFQV